MTIAIDANEANIKNRVGIGRYAFNVLNGIYRLAKNQNGKIKFNIFLKNSPLNDFPAVSEFWQYRVLKPARLWTQVALPFNLFWEKDKYDLLFSTSHYSPLLSTVKTIISVMDLSYLHFPLLFKKSDLFKLKYLTNLSVKKAAKIITISNFSKSEIIKNYGVLPEKIIVANPGIDFDKFKPDHSVIKSDYILYVGTIQPRKNLNTLLVAFKMLKDLQKLRLVIVGQKGWLYHDFFKAVKKMGLENKITFTDYATESELISYYQGALCLVLPSLYEGFGIPVVEAMACGCPVVASNTSSLPEIVGKAGLLIDPLSPPSIRDAIDKIYSDNRLRQELILKGQNRSKDFNWEKTGKIIYTTLTETA